MESDRGRKLPRQWLLDITPIRIWKHAKIQQIMKMTASGVTPQEADTTDVDSRLCHKMSSSSDRADTHGEAQQVAKLNISVSAKRHVPSCWVERAG